MCNVCLRIHDIHNVMMATKVTLSLIKHPKKCTSKGRQNEGHILKHAQIHFDKGYQLLDKSPTNV